MPKGDGRVLPKLFRLLGFADRLNGRAGSTRRHSPVGESPSSAMPVRPCDGCGRAPALCSCPSRDDECGEGPPGRLPVDIARRDLGGARAPAPPQPPPRPPHRAERDTLDVMVPHMRNPRPTPEDLAPFAEFNRRRAVERAWEREARAAPGSDAIPGAHGAGRRYWVNGRCELAAGGRLSAAEGRGRFQGVGGSVLSVLGCQFREF